MTTNSPAAKAPKTPRASKKKASMAPAVELNHTEMIEGRSDAEIALDALIDELNVAPAGTSVTALVAASDEVLVDNSAILEQAVLGAEAVEASVGVASPDGIVTASATPTGDASDVALEAAAAEPKKVAIPRKHYSNKADRLQDRMGTQLQEYSVLTLADAGVGEAELKVKMDETLAIIKAMNKKKQNRASLLIEFLAGKKASLNEVIARSYKVLTRDGHISTGSDGNLFKDLVSRPYSPAAARAMGGNTISMMADLKLISLDSKGKYIANHESLLLAKLNSMMTAHTSAESSVA